MVTSTMPSSCQIDFLAGDFLEIERMVLACGLFRIGAIDETRKGNREFSAMCWLAGWLAGLLAVWLAGWLAGWLVGWLLAGWLSECRYERKKCSYPDSVEKIEIPHPQKISMEPISTKS